MKPMVRRLFYLQKKVLMFQVVFIVMSVTFGDQFLANDGLFALIIPTIVYMAVIFPEQLDESAHYGWVLNSLPATRREIVDAKYLSALLLYVVIVLCVTISHYVFVLLGAIQNQVENLLNGMVSSFLIVGILVGVSIPITIKMAYSKGRIVNIILFITIFNVVNFIKPFLSESISGNIRWLLVWLVIGLLVGSRQFSMKEYLKKEF